MQQSPRTLATRTEQDSMGAMPVPADALFGASTQRAVLNFPISGRPVPSAIIVAFAELKKAAAKVNNDLGRLDDRRATLIERACDAIAAGLPSQGGLEKHFPIDIFQTGSGTSTNMNVNEVVANLVCLELGKPIGSSKDPAYLDAGGVHPNDHVNMGQSSNDTFPTAMHLAAAAAITRDLLPALDRMASKLEQHAAAWDHIVKIGRTHLQDATPIRLGQEFSGYGAQIRHARRRLDHALASLAELALGGTAVGTGINTHPEFGARVAAQLTRALSKITKDGGTGVSPVKASPAFREAANHFEAQNAKDAIVETSGVLKTIAVSLSKISSDIRLMGMGPRCGIGELILPAIQPGSSIMPGKVNPVMCEAVMMLACQVVGADAAITMGAMGGVGSLLDLNVAMPMMADNLLSAITLLANGADAFTNNLLEDLKPDEARCAELIEKSLAMCTSLAPVIGYDKASALAKQAFKEGKTVRQVAQEMKLMPKAELDKFLDPMSMTEPS